METKCSSCEVVGHEDKHCSNGMRNSKSHEQRKAWVAKDKKATKDKDIKSEIICVRHSRTRM